MYGEWHIPSMRQNCPFFYMLIITLGYKLFKHCQTTHCSLSFLLKHFPWDRTLLLSRYILCTLIREWVSRLTNLIGTIQDKFIVDINLWRYSMNKYVMSLKTNTASVPFNFGMENKDLINLSLTLANTRENTSLRFVLTCLHVHLTQGWIFISGLPLTL